MNTVEPIREKKTINKMKKFLKEQKTLRDYTIFTLGINSGLRISDLLNLKISDVLNSKGKLRDRISIYEKKTGKAKDFPISESSAKALNEYIATIDTNNTDSPLFLSRQGGEAVSRFQVYRIINEASSYAKVKELVGAHTMRKTFGYHAYKMGMDITLIQKLLNHSSPAITLSYIGITRDDMDNIYLNLNL